MALIKKPFFILFLLLSTGVYSIGTAQIIIGENDSSWMQKELPSEVMARKKFTLKRKLIQNLLTRFNSYYNARTKLEETVKKASRIHRDNYDSLLTLYPYTAPDFSSLQGNLDSVIFDASYGINIHDPRSKWIDNLYLIAGQAFYYEQDYSNAIAAFQYIIKNKGAKTDENTPAVIGSRGYTSQQQISIATPEKKKLFYHRPSRNDALVWLIRSYIDSGAYNLAGSLLNTLSSDPAFPQRLSPYLLAMQSRFYFNQQMTDKGIPELEKAVAKEENNDLKARWTFILGQYYDQQKNWEKAVHYYDLTARLKPDPLMRFYARLNTIGVHLQQDSSNYAAGMNDMLAMAQREKYELYRSIIYHRLAQYAVRYNHPDEAIAYLKKGLLYNNDNTSQKLKNYYLLAHVLYDNGRYDDAKKYYDSTATLADPYFKHLDEVTVRQGALTDLVVQRNIVYRQDSLQRLAAMPAEDLENFLNEIVQDSIKARRKRNLFISGSATDKGNLSTTDEGLLPSPDRKNSKNGQAWYFYNPALKAKGFSAFRSTWGKRPLADNWRIGSGSATNAAVAGAPLQASPDSLRLPGIHSGDTLNTELSQLMAPIPLSAEQKKKSNDSIMAALFNEAVIFSDRLDNDTAALNTLNELLSRFPDNPQLADIYYRLHILYAHVGDASRSAHYKQLLSEKYPTSKFNAALGQTGPPAEPYAQQATRQLYETAYMSYLDGDYSRVQTLKDSAKVVDPNNAQQARFDLLSAMAAIKAHHETDTGKALLQQVIQSHGSDTPIVKQAQAIINALDHKQELIEHLAHLQLPESPADTAKANNLAVSLPKTDTAQAQPQVTQPKPAPVTPPAKDSVAAPPVKAAPPVTPYKVNANDSYFVVLSFNHTDTKVINECLEKFVAYNQAKHSGEGIEVSNYLINQQVILIFRLFQGEAQALKYYKEIKQNAPRQIIPGLPPNYYNLFIISRDNFILLNSTKDLSGYMKFFSQNYR